MNTKLSLVAILLAGTMLTGCSDDESETVYVCENGETVSSPEQCPTTPTDPTDPTDPVDPVEPPVVDGPFVHAGRTIVDGAFYSATSPSNEYDPLRDWEKTMPAGYKEMRNASYPWGTTVYDSEANGEELWMGTISNGWCVWPYQNIGMPIELTTFESETTGCSVPGTTGTPSQIFIYNFRTGAKEVIHESMLTSGGPQFTEAFKPINNTYGFRAAGTAGDLVFVAGHWKTVNDQGRLRLFVFNAKERSFIGYRDIVGDTTRRFRTLKHADGTTGFYTIVGAETGMTQAGDGPTQLLRWVGTQDAPFEGGNIKGTDPLTTTGWSKVSTQLDNEDTPNGVQYGMIGDWRQFTHTDGTERLIMSASAHPFVYKDGVRNDKFKESVILISDPIPNAGYTADNQLTFREVFGMDQYDPDTKGRWGAKWGTSAINDGYMYFGTYHQGTDAAYKHFAKADPELFTELTGLDPHDYSVIDANKEVNHKQFMINEWRATSIFRINLNNIDAVSAGDTSKVELLYGYETMKVNDGNGWKTTPNLLGQKPIHGKAGMGNPGNVYSWTSIAKDGKLFWGFFDAFSGLHDLLFDAYAGEYMLFDGIVFQSPEWKSQMANNPAMWMYDYAKTEMDANFLREEFIPGGDLLMIEADGYARKLTTNGFGNECSNGIRNVVDIDDKLYFGTSTWCNVGPTSGLEFYQYEPSLDK
ncbi:hypothetical protein [Shewanella sp. UCD-KL12]|uniref:hypothetical protein n=1 Tax=Shewanella sp. UCD-KL12 TaxID=1917163 RepID=UPI0009711840|nr:hypothetical protein [Shewanella sp. UCD-KL12]